VSSVLTCMVTVAPALEEKCSGNDVASGACDELSMLQMVRTNPTGEKPSDWLEHLEEELALAWQIVSADSAANHSELSRAVKLLNETGQEWDRARASIAKNMSLLQWGLGNSLWPWQREQPEEEVKESTQTTSFQRLQAMSMQSPHLFSSVLETYKLTEGVLANDPVYLVDQWKRLGDVFVCAGQVVLADHRSLQHALTSPQARTTNLGVTALEKQNMPALDIGERMSLPIVLSQKEAGGNGDWEAFSAAFSKYMFNDKAIARQQDSTAKALLDELAEAYTTMPHSRGVRVTGDVLSFGTNFFTDRQGLPGFAIRYLHYVLMGLDPHDDETMTKLYNYHFALVPPVAYYFHVPVVRLPASSLMDEVQSIYETAPCLADFESTADINHMTRAEFSRTAVGIMTIAGVLGPLHASRTALGYSPIPGYPGTQLGELDLAEIWDQLDLTDRGALRSYIMECVRLNPPVSTSAHLATEEIKVTMGGQSYTFPKGTPMTIAMNIGNIDPDLWGPSVTSFEAARPGIEEKLMSFHSFGLKSAGRICPGREVTLNMVTDLLAVVGAARRAM